MWEVPVIITQKNGGRSYGAYLFLTRSNYVSGVQAMRLYHVCPILLRDYRLFNQFCPICGTADETTLHALWRCFAAKTVWKELDLYPCLKSRLYDSFVSLCCSAFSTQSSAQQEHFAWVVWSLWNRRNNFVHGNMVESDKSLLDGVGMLQNQYKEANSLLLTHSVQASHMSWTPPTDARLKINADAATQGSSGLVGIGVVV